MEQHHREKKLIKNFSIFLHTEEEYLKTYADKSI